MNKIISILFFLFFVTAVFPQEGRNPLPKSWELNLTDTPEIVQLSPLDMESIRKEDSINDSNKNTDWRFGIKRDLNLDLNKDGLWTQLPNGGSVCRLAIKSVGALSISINFSGFNLPRGTILQLYNNERTIVSETFLGTDSRNSNLLGSDLISGDIVYIEYYAPASVSQSPDIQIQSIVHGYRMGTLDSSNMEGNKLNGSGPCNYDVNCPIGADFDSQKEILKKSVAFVNLGNGYLCTAVLVNNTAADKTPYLLTANHCLTNSNPAFWSVRFNWVSPRPICGTGEDSGDVQNNFTLSGAALVANNTLSDFALVKLFEKIPESWDVAFAGWDNSDVDPVFEVGIHHPNGDIMKVCRDNSGAQKTDANGTWVWLIGGGEHGTGNGWEIGTTESGSSGSPLFNEQGKIIGQLYAGQSSCLGTSTNHDYDIYGRFGVSWDSGNSTQGRLKEWLDPIGSGQSTMETLQNILNVPSFETLGDLKIYPNPANTFITIQNSRYPHLNYQFMDMMGKEISSGAVSNSMNTISVEGLAEGIYLLHLVDGDSNDSVNKKIVVKH